jgi:hypothetical protein
VHPIAELSKVAREFHHVQGEHAREGVSGSWRRRQRARMEELEEKFETLLGRWVPQATEQMRWREHLYRGAEEPHESLPAAESLLFRGRSELGSTLVIQETEDEQLWIVDGNIVDRRPPRHSITAPPDHNGSKFPEHFDAPDEALDALIEYVERRADAPPWAWARELYEDGLIDANFGLTARGRRYRDARR